jgi:hypothetical protein
MRIGAVMRGRSRRVLPATDGERCAASQNLARFLKINSRFRECPGKRKLIGEQQMTFAFWKLMPVEWSQGIASRLKPYASGRSLNAACKADDHDLMLSSGDNFSTRLVQVAFLQGEPTEANDQPLEGGIGRLFYVEGRLVHGWYDVTALNGISASPRTTNDFPTLHPWRTAMIESSGRGSGACGLICAGGYTLKRRSEGHRIFSRFGIVSRLCILFRCERLSIRDRSVSSGRTPL